MVKEQFKFLIIVDRNISHRVWIRWNAACAPRDAKLLEGGVYF